MDGVAPALDWLTKNYGFVGAILGPAGLAGLVGWWLKRPKVTLNNVRPGVLGQQFLEFDVENLGDKATSLEPTFTLTAYTPKREKLSFTFAIEGNDRHLDPHKAKYILAAHSNVTHHDQLLLSWYMVLRVRLTRGRTAVYRCRNADFERIGRVSHFLGLCVFRLFGWLPSGNSTRTASTLGKPGVDSLVAGRPEHPDLREHKHAVAVVQVKLANESRTAKAKVNKVRAFLRNGDELPISWSDEIDALGNPQKCGDLIMIDEEKTIFIRHNAGQSVNYASIEITHNLPGSPLKVIHDDWHEVAANPFAGA